MDNDVRDNIDKFLESACAELMSDEPDVLKRARQNGYLFQFQKDT